MVLVVLIFLGSIDCMALSFDSRTDRYTQLHDYFNQSAQMDPSTLKVGWYSGRCYYETAKDTPQAALLVFQDFDSLPVSDNGPLFPDPHHVPVQGTAFMQKLNIHGGAPNSFDEITPGLRDELNSTLKSSHMLSLAMSDGSLKASFDASWMNRTYFLIRQYNQYLIVEGYIDSSLATDHQFEHCYFFRKVL